MVEVDAGDQQRHVELAPERRGRADDRGRGGIAGFEFAGRTGLDRGEHQVDAVQVERPRRVNRHVEYVRGRFFPAPPLPRTGLGVSDRLGVRLARGPFRGRQQADLEPRMLLQGDQELLAGDSGCPHDCDALFHGRSINVTPWSLSTPVRGRHAEGRPHGGEVFPRMW